MTATKLLKYILLALFVLVPLQAQKKPLKLYNALNAQYATQLDGTQSWIKTTPSNMDLNGSEMITATDDRTFETTVGNWVGAGTVSACVRSTVDPYSAIASMRATSSGAGDTTSNYIKLDYPNFSTTEIGKKYTLELFARSATAARTITLVMGDATVTSGTLTTTYKARTKVVLNFLATANTISKGIYILTSGAIDSLYINNVSLTQAYDGVMIAEMQTSSSASSEVSIFVLGNSTLSPMQISIRQLATTNYFRVLASDGITTQNGNSGNFILNDGVRHRLVVLFYRTSLGWKMFADGKYLGSNSPFSLLGKLFFESITIGATASSSINFTGKIGNIQFLRSTALPDDYLSTGIELSNIKINFSFSHNNMIPTAWYNWMTPIDKSGNGNHLTGIENPPFGIKIK